MKLKKFGVCVYAVYGFSIEVNHTLVLSLVLTLMLFSNCCGEVPGIKKQTMSQTVYIIELLLN